MKHLTKTWTLDPRLEKDTILIHSDGGWQTRLMNDKRWPWIIVVPVIHDAVDVEDLNSGYYTGLMDHLSRLSKALKAMGACTSTNVATLGNVVTQMHWHVVGRSESDPNWPAPVWGFEKTIPYAKDEAQAFIAEFRKHMRFAL